MRTLAVRALAVAAATLALACGGPKYSVIVKNATAAEVTEAHVTYGDFTSLTTSLRPGDHTGHHFVPVPIPDRATVSWRTSDGRQHHELVDVKSILPAHISGHLDLNFDIEDKGVRVWAETQ